MTSERKEFRGIVVRLAIPSEVPLLVENLDQLLEDDERRSLVVQAVLHLSAIWSRRIR
jgi:hypothetical protein